MAAMEQPQHRNRASKVICLCIVWSICSSINNFIGKKTLTNYPYPTTMTLSHMFAVSIYTYPVLAISRISTKSFAPTRNLWSVLIPLGCGKVLASIASHTSIWKVPVSYAHTVKAMMPIFTVLLSRILFHERQSYKVYLSLLPIILGVAIASVTELSFNYIGLLSALAATMMFSLQNLYSKRVIKRHSISHLQLLLQMGQVALVIAFPIWLISDSYALWQDKRLANTDELIWFIGLLLISGFINFTQSIMAFSLINILSSLSFSVSNATKRIFVITSSLILLKNPVTLYNLLGMFTAIFGVLIYNKTEVFVDNVFDPAKYDSLMKAKIEQNKINVTLPTTADNINAINHSPRHRVYEVAKHAYI